MCCFDSPVWLLKDRVKGHSSLCFLFSVPPLPPALGISVLFVVVGTFIFILPPQQNDADATAAWPSTAEAIILAYQHSFINQKVEIVAETHNLSLALNRSQKLDCLRHGHTAVTATN